MVEDLQDQNFYSYMMLDFVVNIVAAEDQEAVYTQEDASFVEMKNWLDIVPKNLVENTVERDDLKLAQKPASQNHMVTQNSNDFD